MGKYLSNDAQLTQFCKDYITFHCVFKNYAFISSKSFCTFAQHPEIRLQFVDAYIGYLISDDELDLHYFLPVPQKIQHYIFVIYFILLKTLSEVYLQQFVIYFSFYYVTKPILCISNNGSYRDFGFFRMVSFAMNLCMESNRGI